MDILRVLKHLNIMFLGSTSESPSGSASGSSLTFVAGDVAVVVAEGVAVADVEAEDTEPGLRVYDEAVACTT